jgi:hypothetical protein
MAWEHATNRRYGGGAAPRGHLMKRPVRCLIASLAAFVGLLWAGPASATDPRIPLTADPVTLPAGQFCQGFDVLVTFVDFNQYIIHAATAPDGTTTLRITGRARATVTNLATGESVSYNISGPGTVVLYPSGNIKSGDLARPNLLYTSLANSFPGVPTISYTTGHVSFTVDASGLTTSYSLAGGARQTDVCAVLA